MSARNGMCFGSTPSTNGGFCSWYIGDGSNANRLAQDGFGLTWVSPANWNDSTYDSSVGEEQSRNSCGLILSPDLESAYLDAGMASGVSLSATWYQPY